MLELTIGIIGALIGFLSVKKVWFNYQIVGQTLDILGVPGVQERVFKTESNASLMQRVVDQYIFFTRVFPVAFFSVITICIMLYISLKGSLASGTPVSSEWILFCATSISGALAWLISFNAAPDWLYESQVIVMLNKSKLDLEVVEAALQEIKRKAESDIQLTEVEAMMVRNQCLMLEELANEVSDSVADLIQQQQEIRNSKR